MAQISRPFQIAFAALALFALVWLLALRGHSTSSGSASSAPASSPSPAAPSSVYHGSAPGVEGLSRAIAKAHGAVDTSQQNAQQLRERSAQASGEAASASAGGTTAPKATTAPSASSAPSVTASHTHAKTVAPAGTAVHSPAKPVRSKAPTGAPPSMQLKVEAELKRGKIVTILFWNPKATDDQAVNHQLQAVGGKLRGSIAVHDALASQVGSFGTIIRGVKVYGTPTVMIINKHGQAKTLTGFTDAYAIEQAIGEARHV
ncbi:MAG TPA: hypothetical protein VNZ01_09045 [Solirubrobacteraceae bacterium]|nr:hypothetical protein [Solirubrobacteraceae bacterium]